MVDLLKLIYLISGSRAIRKEIYSGIMLAIICGSVKPTIRRVLFSTPKTIWPQLVFAKAETDFNQLLDFSDSKSSFFYFFKWRLAEL